MTPFISSQNIDLGYVFYEDYVDLCHPNHPDCVTGVTCDDCNDGFNPNLDVACNLVVFAQSPLMTGTGEVGVSDFNFSVKPNPTSGQIEVTSNAKKSEKATIRVMNLTGIMVDSFAWDGISARIDLSDHPKGIYILVIETQGKTEMKKVVVQ
jgi:hypothetical protein